MDSLWLQFKSDTNFKKQYFSRFFHQCEGSTCNINLLHLFFCVSSGLFVSSANIISFLPHLFSLPRQVQLQIPLFSILIKMWRTCTLRVQRSFFFARGALITNKPNFFPILSRIDWHAGKRGCLLKKYTTYLQLPYSCVLFYTPTNNKVP